MIPRNLGALSRPKLGDYGHRNAVRERTFYR